MRCTDAGLEWCAAYVVRNRAIDSETQCRRTVCPRPRSSQGWRRSGARWASSIRCRTRRSKRGIACATRTQYSQRFCIRSWCQDGRCVERIDWRYCPAALALFFVAHDYLCRRTGQGACRASCSGQSPCQSLVGAPRAGAPRLVTPRRSPVAASRPSSPARRLPQAAARRSRRDSARRSGCRPATHRA